METRTAAGSPAGPLNDESNGSGSFVLPEIRDIQGRLPHRHFRPGVGLISTLTKEAIGPHAF